MRDIAYYNGKTGPILEMTVPFGDRACCFGDGVYDATMALHHIPFCLSEHLQRFYDNVKAMEISFAMPQEELAAVLCGLANQVEGESLMLYWQASRGSGLRTHAFYGAQTAPSLWVTVSPLEMFSLQGAYRALTQPDLRHQYCHVKTINLLANVIAQQRASQANCQEAILHRSGIVTECARSNVHILQGGVLRTAPCDGQILPGIARAKLLYWARQLGIPVREEAFAVAQLFSADEVIFTSSASLCCTFSQVDGRSVGGRGGAELAALQQAVQDELLQATAPCA